jgi:hypothetical protein
VENPGGLGQLYLLEDGFDLFSKIISRPIRRISRKHKAPLSLEKIQTHLIGKWEAGVRYMEDSDMVNIVAESQVFGGVEVEDWDEVIEMTLELTADWKWMTCPSCLSSYI